MKSGFVTLVGRSNVGKSTLLNSIIGTKLAAVTYKPQTTRHIIHGVLNAEDGQAVFVDTPGIFKNKKSPLSGTLNKRAEEAMHDVDLILYVVDPSKSLGEEERYVLSILRKTNKPKLLIINKSDLPLKEKEYLEDYKDLAEDFDGVAELSALFDRHIEPLRKKVFEFLPEGELLYYDDQITNVDEKFLISEIVREKIFLALRKELPYSTHVEVEKIEERKAGTLYIQANIYTNNKKYRKMIIGTGGRSIKEIGIAARKELEVALNRTVYLELEVEVDKHWEKRI